MNNQIAICTKCGTPTYEDICRECPPVSVKLEIKTCKECPNLKTERYLTADSWEHVITWYCGKVDRPKPELRDYLPVVPNSSYIANVERPSEEPKKIPKWCPLR